MQEFNSIHAWLASTGGNRHQIVKVSSLPNPVFLIEGREQVSFSSNNYLGLATHPRLLEAAHEGLRRYGVANCESRLLGGDMDIYRDLEAKLSKLKDKPSAMLFATGFLTNLGALSGLATSGKMARFYGFKPDKIYRHVFFADEFNHVSIREGIKLSGAPKVSYRHCDMNSLEAKLKDSDADVKIIVSDGVFSMDGDIAPLPEMIQLAERYEAIVYLDDAHGTGILGASGAGTTEHYGVNSSRLISMGTLSKAYGAIGGFIAAETALTDLLRFTCSSYGFTSTLPPDQVFAVSAAIDIVHEEPVLRQRLWENQRYFADGLESIGMPALCRDSAILPVLIGDEARCEAFSCALATQGIHVDSILFPAVPIGKARLRFNMNAGHTRQHLNEALDAMRRISSKL